MIFARKFRSKCLISSLGSAFLRKRFKMTKMSLKTLFFRLELKEKRPKEPLRSGPNGRLKPRLGSGRIQFAG